MGKNFRDTLNEQLKDPAFRAEWEAQEPERQIIRAMLDGRQASGLTQQQLAELTGIGQADISRLENGTANPSLRTLKRLAEGLGMTLKVEFQPRTYRIRKSPSPSCIPPQKMLYCIQTWQITESERMDNMKNPVKVGMEKIDIWHEDMGPLLRSYEAEQMEKGQIVFYGPSNFTRWSAKYGNIPLREALPGKSGRLCAINRGFGSSCPEHHLFHYPRLVRPLEPAALVYSPGLGNGMAFGYTPQELFELAQRVVMYALSDFPDLRVYILGLNLNKSNKPHQVEYDAWLREFAGETPNCTYLDITASVPMSRKDIYVEDNVHYNAEGYKLYADFFREVLKDEFDRY